MAQLYEIAGIICLIIIGIAAVKLLGDKRFNAEGFESSLSEKDPVGIVGISRLSPDTNEEGPAHILKDKIAIMHGKMKQEQKDFDLIEKVIHDLGFNDTWLNYTNHIILN